jgi:hypothetical protein
LKNFDKQTATRAKGLYRMLVLDGHKSHESVVFQEYCKSYNIITLGLPAYSSYLTQPLDIRCFSPLKQTYDRQIEGFIKAYINHITKIEFFIAFKAAYIQVVSVENAQAGFRGAGLIPHDPQAVISKLDVKLQTPTPTGTFFADTDPWFSQTPYNPTDALSQITLVKGCIALYQESSPIPIFAIVAMLAKGIEILVYKVTFLTAENYTFRKANKILSKRRRTKNNRIQQGGVLIIEDANNILAQNEVDKQIRRDKYSREGFQNKGRSTI